MRSIIACAAAAILLTLAGACESGGDVEAETGATSDWHEEAAMDSEEPAGNARIYAFELDDIDGSAVPLSQYEGKVLLLVNVASRCGFTKQYAGLQALYEDYEGQGFVILGFPANNFGNQEPGTNAEIKAFCRANYGVTFPMFSKISVKGGDKHPLYVYLTEEVEDESLRGEIGWNFNKFLVGRDGRVVARFESSVAPESDQLRSAVAQALVGG
jgi:glutathione peroxidase